MRTAAGCLEKEGHGAIRRFSNFLCGRRAVRGYINKWLREVRHCRGSAHRCRRRCPAISTRRHHQIRHLHLQKPVEMALLRLRLQSPPKKSQSILWLSAPSNSCSTKRSAALRWPPSASSWRTNVSQLLKWTKHSNGPVLPLPTWRRHCHCSRQQPSRPLHRQMLQPQPQPKHHRRAHFRYLPVVSSVRLPVAR